MSLVKKLAIRGQPTALLLDAPAELEGALAELASAATIERSPAGRSYGFCLVFVRSCAEIASRAKSVLGRLAEDAGVWFAYPKKSSRRYKTDMSRDDGWTPLGAAGFEPVTQIALDEDWSALRFRRAEQIKKLTRRSALSAAGKARVRGAQKAKPTRARR